MATRTEFRVIADRHGFDITPDVTLYGPFDSEQGARDALDRSNPIGFDAVYMNARIQSRTVTETDWKDITDAE